MSGGRKRSVKGIPGGDCDSCLEWLFANVNKVKGRGARAGQLARDQFTLLLDDCVRRLLELALPEREKDTITKDWAGKILAKLHVILEAHQWKLSRENRAYREWKTKWEKTRADVLVPKSEISKMVQEELRTAESYQLELGLLRDSLKNQPVLRGSVDRKVVFERIRDQLVLEVFAGVCRTKLKSKALERRYGALWTKQGLAAIEEKARKATPSLLLPNEIAQSVPCTCTSG